MKRTGNTTLGDWGRSLRDEPLNYIFSYKIYVAKDEVSADEVLAWLKMRYAETRKGNRYRVVCYPHKSGARYVDYILMETCSETDLLYVKMQWGFSETKIKRGERVSRRRLKPEQRKELDAIIRNARQEFFDALERTAQERAA